MSYDIKLPQKLTPLAAAGILIAVINQATDKIDKSCPEISLVWWLAGFAVLITIVSLLIFISPSISSDKDEPNGNVPFPKLKSFVGVWFFTTLPWFVCGFCCAANINGVINLLLTVITLLYAFMVILCELIGLAKICQFTHVR